MAKTLSITSVRFTNFKGLRDFSLSLRQINVLVGPNNAGKSTIVGAFRALATALRRASSRSSTIIEAGRAGRRHGYVLNSSDIPISLENAHTDYADQDSSVRFRLSNADSLVLFFPPNGGCKMYVDAGGRPPQDPKSFRSRYPLSVGVVPILGPVEHEEPLLQPETVQAGLTTHRASRHFRNYWYHFRDRFDLLRELVARTWPGMQLKAPELAAAEDGPFLTMFCTEGRIDRELYWIGSGFQIWCQLLTHLLRAQTDTIVIVDEPEIYLHPDMQRQLLSLFRDAGPDLLLATHSSELIGEADASDIVLINKSARAGRRLRNVEGLQNALDYLGSAHNITLAQLSRTRRVIFVEGNDFKLLRRMAARINLKELASGLEIVPVPVGGFGQWKKVEAIGWGLHKTIGQPMLLGAIFDRDYFCDEEIFGIAAQLRANLAFVSIHKRKELENYLLVPPVLDRCVARQLLDRANRRGNVATVPPISTAELLESITSDMKDRIQAEYFSKGLEYFKRIHPNLSGSTATHPIIVAFNDKWDALSTRLEIVPGKQALSALNAELQKLHNVSLTPGAIIAEMKGNEMPADLVASLRDLDDFRKTAPPDRASEPESTDDED